eukprot:509343-Hanusia_phi.AAC.1
MIRSRGGTRDHAAAYAAARGCEVEEARRRAVIPAPPGAAPGALTESARPTYRADRFISKSTVRVTRTRTDRLELSQQRQKNRKRQ